MQGQRLQIRATPLSCAVGSNDVQGRNAAARRTIDVVAAECMDADRAYAHLRPVARSSSRAISGPSNSPQCGFLHA